MKENSLTPGAGVAKKLACSAMAIAVAMILSNIHIVKMPMGGSVTLFSMFFVCLMGYWFGPTYGLLTGIAYGLLQLIIDPYVVSIPQLLFDYPLAFGALGFAGFFRNGKFSLQIGYLVGVFGRFIFSTLSGVMFFAMYAPEGMNPWVYSITYQGSYLGVEAAFTLMLLMIPTVKKNIDRIKRQIFSD